MSTPISKTPVLKELSKDVSIVVYDPTTNDFARYETDELVLTFSMMSGLRERVKELAGKADTATETASAAQAAHDEHAQDSENPHGVTAAQLGLGNVANLAPAAIAAAADGVALAGDTYEFVSERLSHHLLRDDVLPFSSVVLGHGAGSYCGEIGASVLLGAGAGMGSLYAYKNYVTLGAGAQALGDLSVVLGNTQTQVHAATAMATRADKRDFADAEPLALGLDFVLKLKPQQARMDLREDYIDYSSLPFPPDQPPPAPARPTLLDTDPTFPAVWGAYQEELAPWLKLNEAYLAELVVWKGKYTAWCKANALAAIKPDGTHARERLQPILFADDLIDVADQLEQSFGSAFKVPGMDLLVNRPDEMVPILTLAIQQLHSQMHSDSFLELVAERLHLKMQEVRNAMSLPVSEQD